MKWSVIIQFVLCTASVVHDGCHWGGGGGGGTVGVSHVHHNRDLLKDCHARGGTCPWCPPGSATYVQYTAQFAYESLMSGHILCVHVRMVTTYLPRMHVQGVK